MIFVRFVAPTLLLASAGLPQESDWPKYRGAHGDGVAESQQLARRWGEGGPPELWRRPFGSGFSTVAQVGDRLYTMGATTENEAAFCLDARSGETLWQVPLGARFPEQFGDGPRSTPTVDGELVFAVSSTMQLAALSTADGEVCWRKHLLEEFGIRQPRFGFSPSVVVVENRAILEIGAGEGKAVVAFERDTGNLLWTALDGPASAATPLFVAIAGVPQLIFSRRPVMTSLSLDGEVLWTHKCGPDVIAMAQFVAPDLVFTSSAQMGRGGVMLRVAKTAAGFSAETVWINRRFRNHFNNSVVVDGHLFGFDNSTLRCVDAETGETTWSKRGLGKGSLIACDDLLFVLGDQGTLVLVAARSDAYRELGRVQALQGRCWTSPTLASGRLLVRSLEEIVAYDVTAAAGDPIAAPAAVAASPTAPAAAASVAELADVQRRYAEARGGLARWREVETLELDGTFAAFSESSPFKLQRRRDDLYRFEYGMAGKRDARGRGPAGLWWQFHLFEVERPARVAMRPYHAQLKRESMFEPALLDAEAKGIRVELVGPGKVDAQPTIDLKLTYPDDSVETWKLHPETFLEVAVDDVIVDMTQAREPMDRRTFFSDFREVDGLLLPFQLAMEFGARLEELEVTRAKVGPALEPKVFEMPDAIR